MSWFVCLCQQGIWTSSTPVWRTLWRWGNTMKRPWQVRWTQLNPSPAGLWFAVIAAFQNHMKEGLNYWWFFFFVFPSNPLSSSGVTLAAKGYFDALVKLGELASDSQGSKELGEWGWGGGGWWREDGAEERNWNKWIGHRPDEVSCVTAGEKLHVSPSKEMKTRGKPGNIEREGERTEGERREWGHCWEINNTTWSHCNAENSGGGRQECRRARCQPPHTTVLCGRGRPLSKWETVSKQFYDIFPVGVFAARVSIVSVQRLALMFHTHTHTHVIRCTLTHWVAFHSKYMWFWRLHCSSSSQGTRCFRWPRCTDRSRCSWRTW